MANERSVFSGGVDPSLANSMRTDELYGGDPTAAMMAILNGMGINPYRANPFVQRLLQTAPGLQSAWQLSNIGAKRNDIEANGGVGQMFADFLRGELGRGSVFSTLSNTANNLGSYANQMRDMYGQVGSMDLTQISPFLAMLDQQLNNPMQFAELFSNLTAPSLGPLGKSYEKGVRDNVFGAAQARLRPPDQGGQADLFGGPSFFEYIMGRR